MHLYMTDSWHVVDEVQKTLLDVFKKDGIPPFQIRFEGEWASFYSVLGYASQGYLEGIYERIAEALPGTGWRITFAAVDRDSGTLHFEAKHRDEWKSDKEPVLP